MLTFDRQTVRSRQRGILKAVEISSPALIWSGTLGIIIIAPNKHPTGNRIGKMLDRFAMVTRGELTAGELLHAMALQECHEAAKLYSRGGVRGHGPVQTISVNLSRAFRNPVSDILAAEAVVVQLQRDPSSDYLAAVAPDGTTELFQKIHFMGSLRQDTGTSQQDDAQLLSDFRNRLTAMWADWPSLQELVSSLRETPELINVFNAGAKRDVVVLWRNEFLSGNYDEVFLRTTL